MSKAIQKHAFTLKKTASYYVTHISVAAVVAYAVTGDWLASLTLSLLEPTVQAVVYFFHERFWNSMDPSAMAAPALHTEAGTIAA